MAPRGSSTDTHVHPAGGSAPAAASPPARRPARSRWRDPRLVVGVAVVALCALLGARLVGGADDTVGRLGRRGRAAPGQPVTTRTWSVGRSASPTRPTPTATSRRRRAARRGGAGPTASAPGSCCPAGALRATGPGAVTEVPLSVDTDAVPSTVAVGSTVDVWVTPGGDAGAGTAAEGRTGTEARAVTGAPGRSLPAGLRRRHRGRRPPGRQRRWGPTSTRQVIVGVGPEASWAPARRASPRCLRRHRAAPPGDEPGPGRARADPGRWCSSPRPGRPGRSTRWTGPGAGTRSSGRSAVRRPHRPVGHGQHRHGVGRRAVPSLPGLDADSVVALRRCGRRGGAVARQRPSSVEGDVERMRRLGVEQLLLVTEMRPCPSGGGGGLGRGGGPPAHDAVDAVPDGAPPGGGRRHGRRAGSGHPRRHPAPGRVAGRRVGPAGAPGRTTVAVGLAGCLAAEAGTTCCCSTRTPTAVRWPSTSGCSTVRPGCWPRSARPTPAGSTPSGWPRWHARSRRAAGAAPGCRGPTGGGGPPRRVRGPAPRPPGAGALDGGRRGVQPRGRAAATRSGRRRRSATR